MSPFNHFRAISLGLILLLRPQLAIGQQDIVAPSKKGVAPRQNAPPKPKFDPPPMAVFQSKEQEHLTALLINPLRNSPCGNDRLQEEVLKGMDQIILAMIDSPKQPAKPGVGLFMPVSKGTCDYPTVVFCHAWAEREKENPRRTSAEFLAAALGTMEQSPGQFAPELLARTYWLLAALIPTTDGVNRQRLADLGADAISKTIESLETRDQQRIILRLIDRYRLPRTTHDRLAKTWKGTEGFDQSWLLQTLIGLYEIRCAWDARGSGWAHTVKAEGWKEFEHHLKLASKHLIRAFELDPSCPEAPTAMITVAMGGHAAEGDTAKWFERAIAAQFDWIDAYDRYRLAMLPRWGGSVDQMMQFAFQCAKHERTDTFVPYQAVATFIEVCEEQGDDSIWHDPRVFNLSKSVLEKTWPGKGTLWEHYLKSLLAGIAWHAERYDITRKNLENLNTNIDDDALLTVNTSLSDLNLDAYLYTSGVDELIRDAKRSIVQREFPHAIALLNQALQHVTDWEAMHKWRSKVRGPALAVRDLITRTEFQRDFETGAWVPLSFNDEQLPGWRQWHRTAEPLSPASLKVFAKPHRAYVVLDTPVGRRFEVRGTIDLSKVKPFLPTATTQPNAAILLAFSHDKLDFNHFESINFHADRKVVRAAWRFSDTEVVAPAPIETRFPFHIEYWDGKVAVSVGSHPQPMLKTLCPRDDEYPPGMKIGFGSFYRRYDGAVIFENLMIRKLSIEPEAVKDLVAPAKQNADDGPPDPMRWIDDVVDLVM